MLHKYNILGKEFTNKVGLKFVVLRKSGKSKGNIALFDVQFVDSGYVLHNVSSGHIRKGEVKDYFSPSVFGVGCLGYATGYATRCGSRRIYYTWRGMIRRCYDAKYSKYKYYGGRGVTVCDRWHRLDYFIEDIDKIPGYDAEKFENGEIELDKDIINPDAKIYSPETCSFVTRLENLQAMNSRRSHNKLKSTTEKCNDYPKGVGCQ